MRLPAFFWRCGEGERPTCRSLCPREVVEEDPSSCRAGAASWTSMRVSSKVPIFEPLEGCYNLSVLKIGMAIRPLDSLGKVETVTAREDSNRRYWTMNRWGYLHSGLYSVREYSEQAGRCGSVVRANSGAGVVLPAPSIPSENSFLWTTHWDNGECLCLREESFLSLDVGYFQALSHLSHCESNLLDTIDQDWTLVELSANSELLTTSAANTSATGHLMSSRQLLVDQSIDLFRATLTAAEKVEQATTAPMEQLRALDEHLELLRGRPPDTTFEGLCTFDEEDVLDDLRNELTSALTQRTKALVRVVLDHAKQMLK
ncbi:hypothetical protein EDD18DRAFT_1102063 [Armillaria luteobubalina]|uniref:Uncharacterized protein n=1 Tax=Armillaria luteobubalina TaxID=153913 RepID=A0AA39QDX7_9AGAR|nr:hypothetical protein EDD18DRAFT_1102063 [Armillaria luteobubalina]